LGTPAVESIAACCAFAKVVWT